MPVFSYQARNREGISVEGLLEAKSFEEARGRILSNDQLIWITSIRPVREPLKLSNLFPPALQTALFPVSYREFAVFCRQLGSLLGAGVPVTSSLDTVIDLKKAGLFADALKGVRSKIQEGKTISEAFRSYPNVFSGFFSSIVEVGEASGQIDQVLQQLADHYEYVNQVRVKVRTALTYPVFIITLIGILSLFAIFYLLPQFEALYQSFKAPLPPLTRAVLSGGRMVRSHFVLGFGLAGFALVAFLLFIRRGRGKELWDRFILRLLVIGPLVQKFNSFMFMKALTVLMSSGVSIIRALDIVSRVVPNTRFQQGLQAAAIKIQRGMSIGETFRSLKVLHPIAEQMISVGEKTGSTTTLLEKAAQFYDLEIKATVERMTAAIEPVLIVAIGSWVFLLVISLYLPLFRLAGQILKS